MSTEQSGSLTPIENDHAERLHGFSHEMKNKLSGALEMVRMLAADISEKERDEFGEFAERNLFQALRAVEKLMDDLHVPRGIEHVTRTTMDLALLLEKAITDVGYRTERMDQRVETAIDTDLLVLGDANVLLDAFRAILSNASRFSPTGGKIHVRAARNTGSIEVVITDQGVGLASEDLSAVFTRYAWLSSKTTDGTPQSRGTLARVAHWIALHEGTITMKSDGPGKGCAVKVSLPVAIQ